MERQLPTVHRRNLLELVREVGRSALARENYLSEAVLCGEQAVKEIEKKFKISFCTKNVLDQETHSRILH